MFSLGLRPNAREGLPQPEALPFDAYTAPPTRRQRLPLYPSTNVSRRLRGKARAPELVLQADELEEVARARLTNVRATLDCLLVGDWALEPDLLDTLGLSLFRAAVDIRMRADLTCPSGL